MKEFAMFHVGYIHKGNRFVQNSLNINFKISLRSSHLPRTRNPGANLFFKNMLVFPLNS